MLNRWLGILTAALMLVANVAIFMRDILPGLMAGDPPPSPVQQLAPGQSRVSQVGIFNSEGRNIGRSWTRAERTDPGFIVSVKTTTVLDDLVLHRRIRTPRVRIETHLTFHSDENNVDKLTFRMHGLGVPIALDAEAMTSGEFPAVWQVGLQRGSFVLDSQAPAALGDVIRPFDRLPELYVGRTWRLDLVDPLGQLIPGIDTAGLGLDSVLITVTKREIIDHQDAKIEAYVVEGGGARAWVAPDGQVLRQEVTLPLVGNIILRDEPFDEQALEKAIRSVPNESFNRFSSDND